jgi:hypothetical protein
MSASDQVAARRVVLQYAHPFPIRQLQHDEENIAMVQRQIFVRRPQRLPIPLHQIVPLLLLPPALIGAVSLLLGMSLVPFLCACALSCLGFALFAGIAGKRQRAAVAVAPFGRKSAERPGR